MLVLLSSASLAHGDLSYFRFNDSVGDNTGNIDVVRMDFTFDDATGDYTILLTAAPASPFRGDFRIIFNLFNPDTGTAAQDPSFFHEMPDDHYSVAPVSTLTLTGTDTRLRSWDQGDRVATSNIPFGNPEGSTQFMSRVMDLPRVEAWLQDTIAYGDSAVIGPVVPGISPAHPLLPVSPDGHQWQFDFPVADRRDPVYIDPLVAVGYDYFVDSGPKISSVLLPSIGDNLYDLWLWDGDSWVDSGEDLTGGLEYVFGPGGMDRFRILGIEPGAGLDPLDTTAFATGLWFTDTGVVNMRQVPISFDTDVVPVPGAVLLGAIGLSFAGWRLKRQTV